MNNNFDSCGLEWHTNKLCKKGGGIGLPLSPCSIGGCRAIPPSTQPSHLTSMQCEVQNPSKELLALDAQWMSIMYTEIVLLSMMRSIITILKWGRGELDTLNLIFLLRYVISISLEGEGTSPPELAFPKFKLSATYSIDTQLKEATNICWHLWAHILIVVNGSWLDWNSWRLGPYNSQLQHIFVFNNTRKHVHFISFPFSFTTLLEIG